MQIPPLRRREFFTVLGGLGMWPLVATAQQAAFARRVAVVMFYREDDHEGQLRAWALEEGLRAKGWAIGTNLTIDFRWGTGDDAWISSTVKDLLVFSPSIIVANSDSVARAVQLASKTVPVVFIGSSDPVAQGLVQSFAHPGGNLTGFTVLEPSIGPKWLQLLKEIAPKAQRVSVLLNSANAGSRLLLRSCIEEGSKFGVEVIAAEIAEPSDIEPAFAAMAKRSADGFVVPADPTILAYRKVIVESAARHRLPGVYALSGFVDEGGLISYGVSLPGLFRQAADYVDKILRGERPDDLPVQRPTKFELTVNLRAAEALGITIPPMLLATADRVIE